MVNRSLDALVRRDTAAAVEVCDADDEVDGSTTSSTTTCWS